jgi:hypothetical protein
MFFARPETVRPVPIEQCDNAQDYKCNKIRLPVHVTCLSFPPAPEAYEILTLEQENEL